MFSRLILPLCFTSITCQSGFYYNQFTGPVSGEERLVSYPNARHVDYVANPDYHFQYGVDDPGSLTQQQRTESRRGDVVHGEYQVLDPDGRLRIVKYTADGVNGFQAHVEYQ